MLMKFVGKHASGLQCQSEMTHQRNIEQDAIENDPQLQSVITPMALPFVMLPRRVSFCTWIWWLDTAFEAWYSHHSFEQAKSTWSLGMHEAEAQLSYTIIIAHETSSSLIIQVSLLDSDPVNGRHTTASDTPATYCWSSKWNVQCWQIKSWKKSSDWAQRWFTIVRLIVQMLYTLTILPPSQALPAMAKLVRSLCQWHWISIWAARDYSKLKSLKRLSVAFQINQVQSHPLPIQIFWRQIPRILQRQNYIFIIII